MPPVTVRFMVGDALSQLAKLPDESVHCVVTSPPYWGLRAYKGDPGMIGLEPTFDGHLENLVAVFREVRRVLRADGTLWLNYGDAYAGGNNKTEWHASGTAVRDCSRPAPNTSLKPKDLFMMPARVAIALQADGWWLRSEIIWHKPNPMPESVTDRPTSAHEKVFLFAKASRYFYDAEAVRVPAVRAGDIPAEVPSAANLRNVWTIATHAFNGWTETCRLARVEPGAASDDTMRIGSPDCPSHADQPDLVPTAFCDGRAADETSRILGTHDRPFRAHEGGLVPTDPNPGHWTVGESLGCWTLLCSPSATGRSNQSRRTGLDPATNPPCTASVGNPGRIDGMSDQPASSGLGESTTDRNREPVGLGDLPSGRSPDRNSGMSSCRCSFYRLDTKKESHFATFPPALVEPCVKAGTSAKGVCGECGAPWVREVTAEYIVTGRQDGPKQSEAEGGPYAVRKLRKTSDLGWSPSCDHSIYPIPATCLDPFAGSGTVGLVADRLQRDAILIEISPEYSEMARRRIADDAGLLFGAVGAIQY